MICITLHFFTLIFKFPSIFFRLLFFSVLFTPSFVSSHLSNAICLTHLRRVCKLHGQTHLWIHSSACRSVESWCYGRSLGLMLWSIWAYQVCSTHCMCKQKAVCSRGNKWLAVTCQSELFVQVLVDFFFSLGKFKCRLESGGELNTSADVECYKLCLFVGDGLRCSLV